MGRPKGSYLSLESRAKISKALKGRVKTAEHRARLSASNIGKHSGKKPPWSEERKREHRERMSSPERRKMVGDFHRGRKRPPTTGQRIAESQRGKPKSPEHAEKCRNNALKAVSVALLHHRVQGSFIATLEEILSPAGFKSEYIVGNRVADFALPEAKIIIECDGRIHNRPDAKIRDGIRDAYLKELGWRVIHVKETAYDE